MPELRFPWMETCVLLPLVGVIWVQLTKDSDKSLRYAVIICADPGTGMRRAFGLSHAR